jgi:hypothetical protein
MKTDPSGTMGFFAWLRMTRKVLRHSIGKIRQIMTIIAGIMIRTITLSDSL